jgi:PPOX class probable F420-dependent enzyme
MGSKRQPLIQNRLYTRLLHPAARRATSDRGSRGVREGLEGLERHRYLLLTSFRRDGRAAPTPLWFARVNDALYARTQVETAKVKRIRRNPEVLIAACTLRGRPLEPPRPARARVLRPEEHPIAEEALAKRYGLLRRTYERIFPVPRPAYIEIRPVASVEPGPASPRSIAGASL